MIDLLVFDYYLNLRGEISDYEELEIDRNFNTYSQMVLIAPATDENISILKTGNIIVTSSNKNYGYLIEHINYNDNGSRTLEIVAYSLNFLLTYRAIYPQQLYRGNIEDVIRSFIARNATNPIQSYRTIPLLNLGPISGIIGNVVSSNSGGVLLEHVMKLANSVNATVDILINFNNRTFEAVVSQAVNRSSSQSANPLVFFSREFDNILQEQYFLSLLQYKNAYVVAGEGEGSARFIAEDNTLSGLERRELFVDARDLQRSYTDDDGVIQQIPINEYTNTLISRGMENLLDTPIIETFDAIIDDTQFVYGRDYFVGDIVSVVNERLELTLNLQVSSAKIKSNQQGLVISTTIGTALPNIYARGGIQ